MSGESGRSGGGPAGGGSCKRVSLTSPSNRESDPEGYVFGTGWGKVWNVGGNDMLHNVCVHTDPWLGDIARGRTAETRGVALFMSGGREQALQRFLDYRFIDDDDAGLG